MKPWKKQRVKDNARRAGDRFEAAGAQAFRAFYTEHMAMWKAVYSGVYPPWHVVPAPTVADEGNRRELSRMEMARAVCAELARLLWSERCRVVVEKHGDQGDALSRFIDQVLSENGFGLHMQALLEQMLALGGAAIRTWCEDGRVKLGFVTADCFYPTAWDNAGIHAGVFADVCKQEDGVYTRLERHEWADERYLIQNELYRSDGGDALGVPCAITELYPKLSEQASVTGLRGELFSYLRTPVANHVADHCPLGASVFSGAMSTLRALDICYDSLVQEFRLGKRRLIVPARCLRTVIDPDTGLSRRWFDPTDEAYAAFADDNPDELRIHDNTVPLRVEEHIAALNALLSVLCMQVGFSAGTFTFDAHAGVKTATEVVSENSRTFRTVRGYQASLTPAIKRLVDAIIDVATLYDLRFEGAAVSDLAKGGYEVSITWDDGVSQDRQTTLQEGIKLVQSGLLSRHRFLTDPRYGQGMSEAEAERELSLIQMEAGKEVIASPQEPSYPNKA